MPYLDGSAYAKASENDCVALFPWFCHGFKQLVRQFSGKSHAWPLINPDVSLTQVHCVVTYLKDVFAEVATAFDKKNAPLRGSRVLAEFDKWAIN